MTSMGFVKTHLRLHGDVNNGSASTYTKCNTIYREEPEVVSSCSSVFSTTQVISISNFNPFLTVEKGHFSFETSSQISNFKFGYFSYPFDNSFQYQYQSYFFRI